MPDTSTKLELALPKQSDPFLTSDIRANWEALDQAPGTFLCTSSTRPVWKGAQAGRKIQEVNTGLEWRWSGAATTGPDKGWLRTGPTGLLKRSDGSWAIAEKYTPATSTKTAAYDKALAVDKVVVPEGHRPLRIDVSYSSAKNTKGAFYLCIRRSDTSDAGPMLSRWTSGTQGDVDNAGGGAFYAIERDGLDAGVYAWSIQIHSGSAGGTSTLGADSVTPISISVIEL